jgi:hypothetical protein
MKCGVPTAAPVRVWWSPSRRASAVSLATPKSSSFGVPVALAGEKDVLRFHVAVKDALAMGGVEGLGDPAKQSA